MLKKVKQHIPAFNINMGGIILKQALPSNEVEHVDPFLLLHHGKFSFRDHSPAIQQGIGPHPHRGFSPVTFVVNGEVHHRDSRGNNQIAKTGEVQWMHAGKGIIHSERPSKNLVANNGSQEIIQLWINSPADKKMQQPKYQFTAESDIIKFISKDEQVTSKLIAGNYQELKGKIQGESELLVIWATANENGEETYTVQPNFNTMLYNISGDIEVEGFGKVIRKQLIVFDNEGTSIGIKASSDAQYLLLAGIPIQEKITQQGPFVMNTTSEIMEAMRDYQMGKMGVLIEEH